ncbi:GH25 family lysozyme [[Clostridium] innocuum]|uniref:GH25 family lysozyme n=1 Tax=Clostridium innocuum TaxID=1522 RepID=UPI00300DF9FC
MINVSEHNGQIDWEKVKASNVDGMIIRVGYGYLMEDKYFQYNVSECNHLGIPYGVYLYRYAYDVNFAFEEANETDEMLK